MKSDSFERIDSLTRLQELMIRSCIAHSGEDRRKAVREWEETVVMEDLDFSSSRLVPYFLYQNQQGGITTRHDSRLKIIYKHWWLRSQHLSHQLKIVHEAFTKAGIKSIIIKGASLKTYYEREELRPMADFDLLVHPANLKGALEIIKDFGYLKGRDPVPFTQKHPKLFFDFDHALYFSHPKNHCELDLHWRVGSSCSAEFTDDLWLHLEDYPPLPHAKKPQLAYEVFMLVIHAADSGNRDNLNWILDVHTLNKTASKPFWEEARRLAVMEKKEDLFDYGCAVLVKLGMEAPDPGAVKPPKRLISTTFEDRKQWSRIGLFQTRAQNIIHRVNRLFPHAGALQKLTQMARCIRYYILSRRGENL